MSLIANDFVLQLIIFTFVFHIISIHTFTQFTQ